MMMKPGCFGYTGLSHENIDFLVEHVEELQKTFPWMRLFFST